jgi:uncharacterized repeat protein (TIGR03833 family)
MCLALCGKIFYNNYHGWQPVLKTTQMEGTIRANIKPGMQVLIILKKDQRTGTLTEGIVKDLLTSAAKHHRGIKVRLQDGQIGRVQKIIEEEDE